jgi:hypothetical protein
VHLHSSRDCGCDCRLGYGGGETDVSDGHFFCLDPRHDLCVVMIDEMTSVTESASDG